MTVEPRAAHAGADAPEPGLSGTAWFGIGLALASATQLRLPGIPAGVGEAMLGAWALAAALRLLVRPRVSTGALPRVLLVFWAVATAALAAGRAVAVARGYAPAGGALHDTAAFAFVAAVVLLFTATAGLGERAPRAFGWMAAALVPPLALLALLGDAAAPLPVEPWHRTRFQGWAGNPNQLALALVLVPFAGLAASRAHPRRGMRALVAACAAGAVPLGLLTRSDALHAAWAAGAAAALAVAWLRLAGARHPRARWVARVAVPAALVVGVAVWGPAAARTLRARALATYHQEDAGTVRVDLLRHAAHAWARSPVVGLGPGAHSGYLGPFQREEAHNTFLDWAASTGVVGAAALAALLAWAAAGVLRARDPLLAGGLAALAAFASFHYVLRQPVFWAGLVTLVALAQRARAGAASS
jgi:O-antigen ligase